MNMQRIIINNVVAVGIHLLLCLMTFVLLIIPSGFGHVEFALLTVIHTIVVLLLYCLSGRFILRSTYVSRANLLSVVALAVLGVVGIIASMYNPELIVVIMSVYPLITAFYYMRDGFGIIILFSVSLFPALAMWIGLRLQKPKANND